MVNLILDDCMKVSIPKNRLLLTDIPYDMVNRKSAGLRELNKSNAELLLNEH